MVVNAEQWDLIDTNLHSPGAPIRRVPPRCGEGEGFHPSHCASHHHHSGPPFSTGQHLAFHPLLALDEMPPLGPGRADLHAGRSHSHRQLLIILPQTIFCHGSEDLPFLPSPWTPPPEIQHRYGRLPAQQQHTTEFWLPQASQQRWDGQREPVMSCPLQSGPGPGGRESRPVDLGRRHCAV